MWLSLLSNSKHCVPNLSYLWQRWRNKQKKRQFYTKKPGIIVRLKSSWDIRTPEHKIPSAEEHEGYLCRFSPTTRTQTPIRAIRMPRYEPLLQLLQWLGIWFSLAKTIAVITSIKHYIKGLPDESIIFLQKKPHYYLWNLGLGSKLHLK